MQWIYDKNSLPILWLRGQAGVGKSTTVTTVFLRIRRMDAWITYQFFLRGKSEVGLAIRTLAYDLAQLSPDIASQILKCNLSECMLAPLGTQFKELVLDPILAVADKLPHRLFIVFDALDECEGATFLCDLLQKLADAVKPHRQIRILVTSRPEEPITTRLEHAHVRRLDITTDSDESQKDVRKYITSELTKEMKNEIKNDVQLSQAVSDLSERAGGSFIYASTSLRLIAQAAYKEERLRRILSGARLEGLNELYSTAFSSSLSWEEVQEKFVKIMGLLICGKQSLHVETMDQLLGLEKGASHRLLSMLQAVVVFEGETVRFTHLTVPEYLTDKDRKGKQWHVDLDEQQCFISERCFNVMASGLRFNICDVPTSLKRNTDINDLPERISTHIPDSLQYACFFWAQHLTELPCSEENASMAVSFLTTSFTHWLEVASLTGKMDAAGSSLLLVSRWLAVSSSYASLLVIG